MASDVEICNLALQKLGANRIVSLTEDSKNARECNACYDHVRDAEIRKRLWNFARTQVILAPDVDAPAFDYDYKFTIPADNLRIIKPADADWRVNGRSILTNEGNILYLDYMKKITDTNNFDSAFVMVFAAAIAIQISDKLTQSTTMLDAVKAWYKEALYDARLANAFEDLSQKPTDDTWLSARR